MSSWSEDTRLDILGETGKKQNSRKESLSRKFSPSPPLEKMNGEKNEGASEYDSSDTASSNSTSSTSDSSSSNEVNHQTASFNGIWDTDKYGEFFPINCANNEARFYRGKFSRGSVGKSVLFRSRWMTPNEFQAVSGRQSSKDWKRSIRLKGRCLKEYINEGLLLEHNKSCTCRICLGEDTELLRHEGELALAAKRRRLSQADGGGPSSEGVRSKVSPRPSILTEGTSEGKLPGNEKTIARVKTKQQHSTNSPLPPKIQRVWSPSGEVAQGSSSNDEDEYRPSTRVVSEHEDVGAIHPDSVIDISDFIPRRSKRSAHRKHTGHRTELGTYTTKPTSWDATEVAEFLKLQGFSNCADSFLKCEIDGHSLFLLKEHHLLAKFSMKLGPALHLLDTISRLKHPPIF